MKTKKEVLDLTAKLFPMAKADELLPTRPDDAPRVLIAPDSAQDLVKQGGTELRYKSIRSRRYLNTSLSGAVNGR